MLLAMIPLFTSGLAVDYFSDVDAIKSKGNPLPAVRSDKVCGDQLCSAVGMTSPQPPQGQIIVPESDDPEAIGDPDNPVELLFVQTANSGTFIQKDGRNILTLVEISPTTVWFSDRPHRITGQEATDLFAAKWAYGQNSFAINPPNAALDILDGTENADVIIVELSNPVYSPESETLQYDVVILEEATEGLTHYAKYADATIPSTFSKASLFIDDADLDSVSTSNAIPIPGTTQFKGVDFTKGLGENSHKITIFDFDATGTTSVDINGYIYSVPTSLEYDQMNIQDTETHVYESVKELTTHLSESVGIGYSSPAYSAEVSETYSTDTSTSESSMYVVANSYLKLFKLSASSGSSASAEFQNEVDALPDLYDGNQKEYFDFFSTWGTHYVDWVVYGGNMRFTHQESDTSSTTSEDLSLSMSASVEALGGDVSVDASVDIGSSESEDVKQISINSHGVGGKISLYETDGFPAWFDSVAETPARTDIHYTEIYNLATGSKSTQLQNALSDYLRSSFGYQMLVTNDDGSFFSTIAIGTEDKNTVISTLPLDQDDKRSYVAYGGMMVVVDIATGEVVETFRYSEISDETKSYFREDETRMISPDGNTIKQFNDKIETYERKGEGYLYFLTLLTKFDTSDQQDFIWFEKIGAESFTNYPHDNDINYFVLVGHSDLGTGQGQSLIQTSTSQIEVAPDGTKRYTNPQVRSSDLAQGINWRDDINCEFSGGIEKTIEGFNTIHSPTINLCN